MKVLEERADIDLLITDIVMSGGMNGVEVARSAQGLHRELKVIYCSGFEADLLAENKMTHSAIPLLHKPFQRSELAALVEAVLDEGPGGKPDPI